MAGPFLKEDRTIEESYQDLAGAICEQAVKDYRRALMLFKFDESQHFAKERLEKFFRSDWFTLLVGGSVSGDMVIEEVRKQCKK